MEQVQLFQHHHSMRFEFSRSSANVSMMIPKILREPSSTGKDEPIMFKSLHVQYNEADDDKKHKSVNHSSKQERGSGLLSTQGNSCVPAPKSFAL